jgi:hypothetical protein
MKYIYYALLLSGLIITLIRWKRLDRSLHLFAPLYVAILITEVTADLTRTYFLYHINQAISCIILYSYYYLLFAGNGYRKWIWVALLLYSAFFTAWFIRFPALFFGFDPIDFVVEGVFLTLFSLGYLIELYRSQEQLQFSRHPHFWIAVGNLLFYSGASFFMGFAFTLLKVNRTLYVQLSYIVQVLNLILYSIYIKGLLCPSQAKKPN